MVAECAGRERPAIRHDRETPDRIIGLRQFVGMERRSRERRAAVCELRDGERAMDRLPARGFASRDPSESGREDEAERRPLVGRAEDAGSAGQAAPTQDVGRVGTDPRLRDHVPDQALGPITNRVPVIDPTDDHDQQVRVCKAANGQATPSTGCSPPRRARAQGAFLFLGREAYEAKGGTITPDLFRGATPVTPTIPSLCVTKQRKCWTASPPAEADQRRQLEPVDWIEPVMFKRNPHDYSMSQSRRERKQKIGL